MTLNRQKALQHLVNFLTSWPKNPDRSLMYYGWSWCDFEGQDYCVYAREGFDVITKADWQEAKSHQAAKFTAADAIKSLNNAVSSWQDEGLPQPNINSKILAEKVGSKHDQGKPLYNLIPVHAEAEFVDVLSFGAIKYGPDNWRHVEPLHDRYLAAAMRHIAAYRMGETHDVESGKHHLAHAMCCMAFIVETDLEKESE